MELSWPMRKLLLVIDMQNDFIDGPLGTPEAEAIVDRVALAIFKYPPENIIATRDTHGPDYLETQEGKNLPVPHCIKGTLGWNLHPKITSMLNGATIMGKSTFASKKLAEKVASMAKTEELDITIVGLCTDICVVSNALLLKAYLPETPIHVIASCCAGVTPESHQAALKTMQMCQIDIQE